MKKPIGIRILALAWLAAAVLPVTLGAQGTDTGGLSPLLSISLVGIKPYTRLDDGYDLLAGIDASEIAAIEGSSDLIDSDLEAVLLVDRRRDVAINYMSAESIKAIDAFLGTPGAERDRKLYAIIRMKAASIQFSSMDPSLKKKTLANYELMMKSIIAKGNITASEAESFYKTAVTAEVDRVVGEEFSKVSFMTTDNSKGMDATFSVILNKKGTGYAVSYRCGGDWQTVSVTSLSELSKYGFTPKQIEDCTLQANNIPILIYSNLTYPQDERNPMKVVARLIKDFLLAPDETKFNTLASLSLIYWLYSKYHPVYETTDRAFGHSLGALSPMLVSSYVDRVNQMAMGKVSVAFYPEPKALGTYLFPVGDGVFLQIAPDGRETGRLRYP